MNTTIQRTADPEKAIEFVPYGAADKIKLSVKIIQNMVAVPTKSGKTCTERDALRFLMLCQAQRLNPFAGDAYLVGYDSREGPSFSLITAHQAFLKRAETCPEYEGMESGVIILDGNGETVNEREGDFHLESEEVVGGWARVHRKGRKDTYRRIRLARFNKGFAQWQTDPAGMIVKCAEADALRSTFPTLLGGLYIQGEQNEAAGRIVSDIATTKPIFEIPARAATPQQQPAPETESDVDADGDLGPQAPKAEAKPAQTKPIDYLRGIKGLLKLANITEAELLNYMRRAWDLDESLSSLQEIIMVAPETLERAYNEWATVSAEINQAKGVEFR